MQVRAGFTLLIAVIFMSTAQAARLDSVSAKLAQEKGCLSCHEGIEAFSDGPMMAAIKGMATPHGDPGGCVICHGGSPQATTKAAAHKDSPVALAKANGPEMFYPNPSSVWIADKTCGLCHQGYTENLIKSLMNTEAGKLQGNLWSWGVQKNRKSIWGNYD